MMWLKRSYLAYAARFERTPERMLWALVLGLLVIDLLLVRDLRWTMENISGKRFYVNFLLTGFVYWALLFCARGLVARHRKAGLLLFTGIVVSYTAQSAYFDVYRKFVTVFDFRFFADDPWLTLELWWEHGSLLKTLLVPLLAALLIWPVMISKALARKRFRIPSGVFATLLFLLATLSWYGTAHFQLTPVAYFSTLAKAVQWQSTSQIADKPELVQRKATADQPNMVFVVGESLNKGHLSVYGYDRETTPGLNRLMADGQLVPMNNAVSVGPRTLVSVPYMLVGLEGIDPEGVIYGVPTIFNYAKSAGYRTGLITAQDFQWRKIDRLFVDKDMDHFQQGTDFSANVSVSIGADDMDVMNKGILPFLEEAYQRDEPYMLVTQMSGSHTPFSRQVPQAFKKFLPEESKNSVNAYDNTVLYADLYLTTLVDEIRKRDPNAWVFYSSDHGEHVEGDDSVFHSDFKDQIIHNPLLVFPPKGALEALKANQQAPVSQADIVATMLDLMNVKPVLPIDGLSLVRPIPEDRMRISTAYMKTLHNDPRAALVFPDLSIYQVDFERGSVKMSDGETLIRYEELPEQYRQMFDRRMQAAER